MNSSHTCGQIVQCVVFANDVSELTIQCAKSSQSCHFKLERCPPLQSTFCSHCLCCALSLGKVCKLEKTVLSVVKSTACCSNYVHSTLLALWSAGQSCLDGFPSVTDNTCTSSSCPFQGDTRNRQLRLFPSMNITCNGMLVGLSVAGETRDGGDYPILQIWRPTGPTSNDYYENQ